MTCKEVLRSDMQEHSDFLWHLFSEKKTHNIRRILLKARNSELCVLIKILYCIEEGHIPIKKTNYNLLLRSRRMKPILELKHKVKEVLRLPVGEKQKWALQFSSLYKYLLFSIFNKD